MARYMLMIGAAICCAGCSTANPPAVKLDQAAIDIKRPDQIPWKNEPGGVQTATLVGDPSKPGIYVQLVKSPPHNTSAPHFHANDRFIRVISGTWWVGTGKTYDRGMVPLPAGSAITLFANQLHFEGTKDEPVVIEIVGMGPVPLVGEGAAPADPRRKSTITPLGSGSNPQQ